MAKGDVTEVRPSIDSVRLWWFIANHRFPNNWPSQDYRRGYTAALDDLANWLRGAGY